MTFHFESLADFMHMSGHGPYVWAAYGITFAAIVGLVMTITFARKNFFAQQRSIAQRAASSAAAPRVDDQNTP